MTPSEHSLALARTLIALGDYEHAAETLAAYVLAVAALSGETPRAILEHISDSCPDDEAWEYSALPELMDGVQET